MRNQTSEAFAYIEREYMTARGTKEAMRFEDDLRRIDEHIAEARRLVQRQKGLIIRLRAGSRGCAENTLATGSEPPAIGRTQ